MLGGSGFVGRALAARLARDGFRLRILTRDREARRAQLILLPDVELVQANVHDGAALAAHFAGCDAVINLVGILNERGRDGSGFRQAHVELARKVVTACTQAGVGRLLQMSALNAARQAPSHYLRSKGEAEDLVHAATGLQVTSFRPSVIFGRGDGLFCRFAGLLRLLPGVFPLACAGARFAPVWVGDVAEAMRRALGRADCHGRRLELCGPHSYTLRELVEYTARCCGLRRLVLPLPDLVARLQAALFDFVPGKPFSTDNYLSASVDSVCGCNDLPALGIEPLPIDAVVPDCLRGGGRAAFYDRLRVGSRRTGA